MSFQLGVGGAFFFSGGTLYPSANYVYIVSGIFHAQRLLNLTKRNLLK